MGLRPWRAGGADGGVSAALVIGAGLVLLAVRLWPDLCEALVYPILAAGLIEVLVGTGVATVNYLVDL